uniref:Uncharacterized protein n=1 Tax=Romanomermis culicivorax TaxID=13658 RepID=A0A915J2B4_ROMCU
MKLARKLPFQDTLDDSSGSSKIAATLEEVARPKLAPPKPKFDVLLPLIAPKTFLETLSHHVINEPITEKNESLYKKLSINAANIAKSVDAERQCRIMVDELFGLILNKFRPPYGG